MKKFILFVASLVIFSVASSQCVFRANLANPSCGGSVSIGSIGSKQYVNAATTVGNSYCASITSGTNGGFAYTLTSTNFTATSTSRYIEVRANGGCNWYTGTRTSATLTVREASPTNTTSTASLCEGSTRTVSATVSCGSFTPTYTENGTGSISGTTYSTGNITANQTVTVVARLGTCTSSRSFLVYADPIVSNTTSTASICVGGTKTLVGSWSSTGGAGTGTWSIVSGGGTISGTTYTATSAGTKVVRYTVVNGNCSSFANRTFTVVADPSAPTITKSPNTATACEGTTLTVTSSGGSGGVTCSNQYRFSTNNGSTWSSWSGTLPSFAAVVGTNIVQTRRTCSGSGCGTVNGTQRSWTVIENAAVGSVSGASPICIGDNTTYSVSGVVLGGGTGSWSSSNTGVATVSAGGVVTGVAAGSANIIYTVAGGCGGTQSAQQSITITPNSAVASVSGTSPLCIGATATYTASGVVLGGGTGAWSSSNTGVATVSAGGVVTGVAAGSANIIYTVSGGCNGPASAQQSITINPDAAVGSVSGTSPLCTGATTTYTASGVVLGGGTGAWSSSNTGVATVNAASGVVTGVAAGSANIIYTVTGGCNGTPSAQQSVTVLPVPNAGIVTGTSPLCIAESATYLATGVVLSGGTGAWSSSNPAVATVNALGLVTGVTAGSANIIYTVTSACGTTTAQQAVLVNPDAAVGSVSGASPICLGSTTTYTASGVVLGGGTGAWSSSNTGVATVDAAGVVTPVAGGTANIIYTVTGGCNGTPSAQQAVTINAAATNVVLVTGTTTSAVATCVESPWTYYANAGTPDDYIFAIRKNGNTFVANVEITDQAGNTTYSSTGGAGPDRGTFLIGRHWNVTLSSGSVSSPVDIRFFVDPAEVTQAQSEATAFLGTTAYASTMVGLTFFKTVGSAYSPGMMANGDFTFTPQYLSHSTGTLNGITYYELTGLTSFSGGTGGFSVNDDGSTLPVELLSWEAKAIDNEYVGLNWSTATEINNAGFEIQRSLDGVNFEAITWIEGHGNSNEIRNYVYEDREVSKGERYYYQLKQIDYDGASETFHVVTAELNGSGRGLIGAIRPNPSKENGFVSVDITSVSSEVVNVSIYNHVGQKVAAYSEMLTEGNNNLQIAINDLSSGTYFINFEGSFGQETRKLIVIK